MVNLISPKVVAKQLKWPLQALLIAPDQKMRTAILEKIKKITIREGHRDYHPGPVMLCCHLVSWAVMADIVEVKHCTLIDVTIEEYRADGFENKAELASGMKKFYPNMNLDSPVTVIRWENVRGYLVDNWDSELHMPKDLAQDLRAGR